MVIIMKKVYLAVDFINEQYCIGFYTSKYASTHFSALAKHLGIDVKKFTLLTPTKHTGIKGLEKMIHGVYNSKYQLLNKSQKVNAYIYRHIERKITPELTLLREVFLAKYDLSDIEGCENETPIEIVEDDFKVTELTEEEKERYIKGE